MIVNDGGFVHIRNALLLGTGCVGFWRMGLERDTIRDRGVFVIYDQRF